MGGLKYRPQGRTDMTVREDPDGGIWVQNGPSEVYLGQGAMVELSQYFREKWPTPTEAVLDALKELQKDLRAAALPLDPLPWASPYHDGRGATAREFDDSEWKPREGYEQDRSKY